MALKSPPLPGKYTIKHETRNRMRCHYEVLGILRKPPPTHEQLQKAYRLQARALHPDRNHDDPGATARFQELQASYAVLSNVHDRAWYDAHRTEMLRGAAPADKTHSGASTRAQRVRLPLFLFPESCCADSFSSAAPRRNFGACFPTWRDT